MRTKLRTTASNMINVNDEIHNRFSLDNRDLNKKNPYGLDEDN